MFRMLVHVIDKEVNQKHIDAVRDVLKGATNGEKVEFHFAIMEVEAWLLGMHDYLLSFDKRLTSDYIKDITGVDLDADPEKTIVHPAVELGKIYGLVGKQYDKNLSDIETIMSILTTDDFCKLMDSGKCHTFKMFVESLLN